MSFWSKAVRTLKRGARGIDRATHNKLFEAIHKKIASAVPKPYDVFVKIGTGSSNVIHKGLESAGLRDRRKRAKALLMSQIRKGDKKAVATLKIIRILNDAKRGRPEAAVRLAKRIHEGKHAPKRAKPPLRGAAAAASGKVFRVLLPNGRTVVVPASKVFA